MHFGENQLSPRSVGISPLSTAHPPVLQHWWVRASTDCHIRFTLAMDSSRGFGSHRRYSRSPSSDSVSLRLPSFTAGYPGNDDALAGSFYKRHAISPYSHDGRVASDCLSVRGFRHSFIPLSGCFSPFPHGTCSLSVAEGIEPWRVVPPASHKLTGVRGTQDPSTLDAPTSTGLSPPAVVPSSTFESVRLALCWSYNPTCSCEHMVWALPVSLATTAGISLDFFSSGY
jgi:hypothetical protein